MNKDTLLLVCFYTVDNINLNEIKFSHLVCRTADRGGIEPGPREEGADWSAFASQN